MSTAEEELCRLVAELAELDPGDLDLDTPFPEVEIDSLLAMEIAVHVEVRYGVRFEDSDIKEIQTIRQLAAMVSARIDA